MNLADDRFPSEFVQLKFFIITKLLMEVCFYRSTAESYNVSVTRGSERKTSLGKDWHGSCLRCEQCNKTLTPGSHAEHESKPFCNPCYSKLFGPKGFGRGGAESYVYNK